MSLPEDIQKYRQTQLAFHTRVSADIVERWLSRIVPNNLHLLGEQGAEGYLARFGRNIGEEKTIHLAIKAEIEGYQDMADGFWKKAHSIQSDQSRSKAKGTSKSNASKQPAEPKSDVNDLASIGNLTNSTEVVIGRDASAKTVTIKSEDRNALREWWHEILRTHGRYSCYGIFLTLPSDLEVLRYLTDYGKELYLISGKNCLVIALSTTNFQRTGFDEGSWRKLVEEHTSEGHSVTVAQLFGIEFTQFPCLLLFQDIRSPEHIAIKLTEMTAEQIAAKMRLVFTVVQNAIKEKKKPLHELEKQQNIELLQKTGQIVASKLGGFAEKTFEKAMEAWINATIKQ